MTWLQSFAADFAVTIGNADVWLSIGLALLLAGACLVFGTWVARTVGLLEPKAPGSETVGVGLASGLMVLAAWWAAIWSGGRSSFTPVAVGFALAIAMAVIRRARRPADRGVPAPPGENPSDRSPRAAPSRRPLLVAAVAGGLFVVAIAILNGSTMAPSPRDGAQPVEFNDVAFYSILGRDLATTGTETALQPSGFSDLPGLPAQAWYHWGEIWLASAVIAIFGTAPLAARYFVVLPVVLLAAAALTGTLVRRFTRTPSPWAYLFGFVASLFLAPVPLIQGPFFSSWAVGMIFSINLYGLVAVAVPLVLYSAIVLQARRPTPALAVFVGTSAAFTLPAHIVVALLALIGAGSVAAFRIAQALAGTRRLPTVPPVWRGTLIVTAVALVATALWAVATDHAQGGGTTTIATPFNASWRDTIGIVTLGAGIFLAIGIAWVLRRRQSSMESDLYLATIVIVVVGAIWWGAWIGDFTTFYLFFAGIAVFATPAAAIAVRAVWAHLRATSHPGLAAGIVVLSLLQLEWGLGTATVRMRQFGSQANTPIPVSVLDAIRQLPPGAKLAYACRPLEEVTFATPKLLSIDAHTGHRVVPMCFEAEVFSVLVGVPADERVENLSFKWAPQRVLYPDATARPSSSAVAAFLKGNGIAYIYADAEHPNSLVDGAIPVATSGSTRVLRIP